LAKRVRGQRTTHRPGRVGPARPDREPTTRISSTGAIAPIAAPSTSRVAAPAPVVGTASAGALAATRDPRVRTRLRSSGLDQKAAAETEWVTDDLRRIGVISAIMVAGLALAWVLLVVVGLGDFY
jgi:hypothetical protein